MPEQSLDSRGRVTIAKGLRPLLGRRFVQVLMPNGIHLVPLTGKVEGSTTGPRDLASHASRIATAEVLRDHAETQKRLLGVSHAGKRRRKPAHRVRKA